MFRTSLCSAYSVLVFFSITAATSIHAATFKDPLAVPAMMSRLAQSSRLTAIAAAGSRLVAVGPAGRIVTSDDTGVTWTQAPVSLSSDLVSVRFVNAQHGWVVGHDGVVLHSADGGRTWAKQLDGFMAVKAMKEYYSTRPGVGEPYEKLKADVERFVQDGADKPFLDVLFLNEKEGFIVGAFNFAFHTKDGGLTWEPLIDRTDNPQAMHLYGLTLSGQDVYMVGEQGLIRRWNAKLGEFEHVDSPYKGSFFGAVGTSDGALIIYGMRGTAYRSVDAGANWRKLDTRSTSPLVGGTVLSDGRVALVALAGEIFVTTPDSAGLEPMLADKPMRLTAVATDKGGSLALTGFAGVRTQSMK